VAPLTPRGLPIGGFSMLESSAEIRWTSKGGNGSLGLVAFVDAGNVWNRSWRFYVNDLRADVGGGIRYLTLVGPLRVDVAYQVNPIEELIIKGALPGAYRRWRFHFSIGQAF
jgi:outer membrane translocation and assembly module TamA